MNANVLHASTDLLCPPLNIDTSTKIVRMKLQIRPSCSFEQNEIVETATDT